MRIRALRSSLALLLVAAAVPSFAQTAATSPTRTHVQTLASEKFGGREAGSDGERLAADYISTQLQRAGVRPLPGRKDLFVPFEFVAGTCNGNSSISINGVAQPA